MGRKQLINCDCNGCGGAGETYDEGRWIHCRRCDATGDAGIEARLTTIPELKAALYEALTAWASLDVANRDASHRALIIREWRLEFLDRDHPK